MAATVRYIRLLCLLIVLGFSSPLQCANSTRPNIVFLLADDLGFSDIEPYGSEISTPTLSRLAADGITFTNYHTAANCAPARAMLLTGVSSHLAGVPNIPEMISPSQLRQDNYQGVLGDNVVTIATLLEDAGYHTYLAGKWHLGSTPEKLPSRRGFQRTIALMDSGADNWEQRPYLPIYTEANWFADGERYVLPDDFYSSEFLIDKTIEFIDGSLHDGKPFFAYVPFQAVHIPVQAPQDYIDRYIGRYDGGWHELREERLSRAVSLGILPDSAEMVRMPTTLSWSDLTAERQRYEAKRMAVYAGMIESMDAEIGRLLEYLKDKGQLDNTLFIFTSDNGAEGSGAQNPSDIATQRMIASLGYTSDYETLGQRGSFNSISPGFTSAAVSPLAYYKFYAGEGGLRVPLIISGEPLGNVVRQTNAFAWATDIAATILSMAGAALPGSRYGGRPVLPITGKDLMPLIEGRKKRVYGEEESIGYELTGHAALFQGDYKLVRNLAPLGDGEWRLFDIVSDPGETKDLKLQLPDRFDQMLISYQKFTVDNRVQPLPEGYSQQSQLVFNMLRDQFGAELIVALLTILIILPFIVFSWSRKQSLWG